MGMTASGRWMDAAARHGAWLLFAFTLAWSGEARALTMDPNPVAHGSDMGRLYLELIDVVQGVPTGGTVLAGAIAPHDTTLVLQLRHEGLLAILGIDPIEPSEPFLGAGWIPGEEPDALADVLGVSPDWVSTAGLYNSSSDLFFVSYAELPLGEPVQVLSFHVVFVPEPSVAQLLILGLAIFACRQGLSPRRSRAA